MRAAGAQALALCALLAGAAEAAPYQAPPLTGHVVDTAGLLSPSEKLALDRHMEEIRLRTGFELVAFLDGTLADQSIEDVAYGAFNQWKIGQAGKDNGVLLVIAPKERKVRIETGKGVGGALTDLQSSDIIQKVIAPLLRDGRYAQAIASGVDAIAVTLTKGTVPTGPAPAYPLRLSARGIAIAAGLFLIVIILMIVSPGFRSAVWTFLQFFLLFRFLGGGRGGGNGGGGGGSGYSGGGGSSGGGGASGSY